MTDKEKAKERLNCARQALEYAIQKGHPENMVKALQEDYWLAEEEYYDSNRKDQTDSVRTGR